MSKVIVYDEAAKQKMLAGVEKLEKAVAATLGPCGKNVIVDEFGSIHSTRDGVTVAKAVELKDRLEGIGASAVREVAEKSADRAGDGTTTSTVLAASIFRNGLKYVALGMNATQIKNGIKAAADEAVRVVRAAAKPVSASDAEAVKKVAVVSANGDERIGEIIADVMGRIGADGTVKVENGSGIETSYSVAEGMVVDKSYASPYMVTNPETLEAELDNPWVLVVDGKLSNFQELLPALQAVSKTGAPLFVMAESYADEVLATLIMNKMRGGLNSVAVCAPSYGENRRAILEDIAVLTGGAVVSESTGVRLESAVPGSGVLGMAKRIVVNKASTIILGGMGDQAALAARVASLKSQIESCQDEFDASALRERLAKLTAGVGVISVGATTDAERKELRDRVDDAFCAVKAALRGGTVPGGGTALIRAKAALDKWAAGREFQGDEGTGAKILADSLDAPARRIVSNAGLDAAVIVGKMVESGGAEGYDVLAKEFCDMEARGIVDPADVVANEIQNAASIAGLLLTTDVLISDEPDAPKGA